MFLNDVLPYASINERRDDWREDFHKQFQPLAAEALSAHNLIAALLKQTM